jgi:hypothetical protein
LSARQRSRYTLRRKADIAEGVVMEPDAHTNCYTHAMHAKACALAASEKRVLKKYVQVSIDGVTECARIIDAWDMDGVKSMWKVRLIDGRENNLPVRLVRSCSGEDGRCKCAGES